MTAEREQPNSILTLAEISQLAKEVTLEGGQCAPTLIVNGSEVVLMLNLLDIPDTHEGRARMMFSAGRDVARQSGIGNLRQVYFISEAWMSVAEKGKTLDRPPSQDPNRIEALVISGFNLESTEVDLAVFEMVRDSEGTLTELKDFQPETDEGEHAESPLLWAFAQGFKAGSKLHTDDA